MKHKMYSIKLNDELRIEYATYAQYASENMISVEFLPDGDIHNYLYIDGEYVYSPLSNNDIVTTPSIDERVSALEDALMATKVLLGVE